jgi:hypothetical protein
VAIREPAATSSTCARPSPTAWIRPAAHPAGQRSHAQGDPAPGRAWLWMTPAPDSATYRSDVQLSSDA